MSSFHPFSPEREIHNILLSSFMQTQRNQLSPIRAADGPPFLSRKELRFSNLPLCSNIQHSTFHRRASFHPFSPEREIFEPLPLSIQIHSVRLRCLFSSRYLYLRQKMYIYYFMLYLAESLTGRRYAEGKLLRYYPLWREMVKVANFVCCRQIPMGFGKV